MTADSWKYVENQFLVATVGDLTLMGEIISDHLPRLTAAQVLEPTFTGILAETQDIAVQWTSQEGVVASNEAGQKSATLAFTEKILGLTHKPDADTNSPLETWDSTIRSQVPYQGTVYTYLLPDGREPLSNGTYEERLDALRGLGLRLAEQVAKPVLVTLGGTVSTYYNAAKTLRDAQTVRKSALTAARQLLEELRIALAQQMHGNLGFALYTWRYNPARIETLWDLSLLRQPTQTLPAPPADTAWAPNTLTLSTTTLPAGATRLVAWRLAPGGAPEQLATGDFDALTVTIPGTISFTPGVEYQLWLQSRNAKGQSEPGPVTEWMGT
ncbi:MAG: fibronectin type III domain-containing protein [Chthoniobacter sp.]|nr:fibronectin type III domain-containing protein [Chthoniobacter sp.]